MSTEFKREERYIVFKVSDVERYLTDADRAHLAMMKNEIDAGRDWRVSQPSYGMARCDQCSPGGQAMKQHEFRELVNELRDTAIKYHASQELRERIVHVLWAYEVFPDALPHQRQAPGAKP